MELPEEYQEAIRQQQATLAQQRRNMPQFDEGFYRYFSYLIEIERIPEDVIFSLWGLYNKVHQLTQFTAVDIAILEREIEIIFTKIRNSIPEYEYDYVTDLNLKQTQIMFFSMIKRSENGFERRMEATQISQQEHTIHNAAPPRAGFIDKVGSFIGYKPNTRR